MAISRLSGQDASNTSATTSVTTTYPSPPTQGNLLIACLYDSDNFAGIVPPAGWQLGSGSNDTGGHSSTIWWKVAQAGEPTGVTFNDAASGSIHLVIYEYTGGQGSYGVDQTKNVNSGGAAANAQATGTANFTTQPNQLLIAAVGFAGSGSAPSWTNSFNARQSTTRIFTADRIVSVTGSYSTTCTVTGTAVQMTGNIVTFVETKPSFKVHGLRPHPFSPGRTR